MQTSKKKTGRPAASGDMAWFREARYGMFIHFGLYSMLGRGEWVMHNEGIPVREYERLAKDFRPAAGSARKWAELARRAGMGYMVLTTKHHDGFCLFDTKQTGYSMTRLSPGRRDLVREYVEACRAEGLRVGLYFSLGDWHEPCYLAVARGEKSRNSELRNFIHGQVRELMTNYGKIDLLWYDGAWFDGNYLTAETLGAAEMNAMARELQPGIVINPRSGPPEDYDTCENECRPAPRGRDWEMCTCINDMWGYTKHDYNYKTYNQLLFLLANCSCQGGNFLLNIGPKPDGSVPAVQEKLLLQVGRWMNIHGDAVRSTERLARPFTSNGRVTRKDGKLYYHVLYWPGKEWAISDITDEMLGGKIGKTPVRAQILTDGTKITAKWFGTRLLLRGLPENPPDKGDTVIVIEPQKA